MTGMDTLSGSKLDESRHNFKFLSVRRSYDLFADLFQGRAIINGDGIRKERDLHDGIEV